MVLLLGFEGVEVEMEIWGTGFEDLEIWGFGVE